MRYFFEVLTSKIGYSRIGRIPFSKERKLYISTPNIIIPIRSSFMKQFSFIQEFENHDLFTISKDFFLKIGFINEKLKNNGLIFTYSGSLQKFQEILTQNVALFSEDNIISLIPFNIPTTSINKEFALNEIKKYLLFVEEILANYPDLYFGLSIKTFDYTELLELYIPLFKKFKNIKIINFASIFDNLSNFRHIIKCIVKIKTELDNNLIVMASGRIIPKIYPILVYLGVDIIDCSYSLFISAENFYDTIEYLLPIYKLKYFPCSCVACKSNLKKVLNRKYSAEKLELLSLHNLITAYNYMKKIKQYLDYEDFRSFIEKTSFDDTNLISILKILDKEYFDIIKYNSPMVQKSKNLRCLGPSSYNRPDFQHFRERLINNFEPEPWTKLIILIPCSARKPYSESISHRKYYSIMRKFPEFPSFQELIITSPLGCVPRQLENIYPVNSYDISVTGEWDNEEIKITTEMLIKVIEKYDSNIPIICHLKNSYVEIARRASSKLPHNFIFAEISDKTTSVNSLQSLEKLIINYKNEYHPQSVLKNENYLKTWTRKFIKIIDYQFGKGAGFNIISNGLKTSRIKFGDQIDLRDPKTKKKLGVFKFSTGQIELTIVGFKKLFKFYNYLKANYIVFDGDEFQGNTLFRPGVIDYSKDLIPNNQVAILNKEMEKVIGSGMLYVGSNFIKNSKSGRIVKINERK
jgi:archaeosine synthase